MAVIFNTFRVTEVIPPPTPTLFTNIFPHQANGGSTAVTVPVPAGSNIFVSVFGSGTTIASGTMTDSQGNSYLLSEASSTFSNGGSAIYYCLNSTNALSTSDTITLTGAGGWNCMGYFISGFNGGYDSGSSNNYGINGGGTTHTFGNGSGSTAAAGELVFVCINNNWSATFTGDSKYTDLYNNATNEAYVGYFIGTSGNQVDYNCTMVNAEWIDAGVSMAFFKPG